MDDQCQQRGAASSPPDPPMMRLVLLPSGMRVDLTKADTLVGRHSSADIRLPLPDVSRQHCRFVFRHATWHVVDLNSLNGVFVNNQRVKQIPLRHGDRIRIGGFIFQVELPATQHADLQKHSTYHKEQRRAS
jgi:pSer/pThr/pTyr-binding forkhead associated (FHA) protein